MLSPSITSLSDPDGVPSKPSKHVKYPPILKSFSSLLPLEVMMLIVYSLSPETFSNSIFPVKDLLVVVSVERHHRLSVVISNVPLRSD